MGIVKWTESPKQLNLAHVLCGVIIRSYKMGNAYAIALSKGLKQMNREEVNISDNRLSRTGSQAIIRKLNSTVKHLNASHNNFDSVSATTLGQYIKYRATGYLIAYRN